MPLYEYRCNGCETRFEVLQSMGADGSSLECPSCGAPKPDKLLSTFACGTDGASAQAFGGDCAGGSCATPSFGGGCCGGACSH